MYLPSCFLLSLILCGYFADVAVFITSDAEVMPKDPLFDEGDTIVLNCTLAAHFNGTKNSSLIAFRHNGTVYGSEFVHPLTPQTAQLQIPNATLDHHGFFMCFLLPNTSLSAAFQHVVVARRPLKPSAPVCHVFNWESLVCSWKPTTEEQKNHSMRDSFYTAAIWNDTGFKSETCRRYGLKDLFILTDNSSVVRGSSCNFQMGRNYTLQIEVANVIANPARNVTSDSSFIQTSDIVLPNPPENVAYSFSRNETTVSLDWNPPKSRFRYDPLHLTYAVSFRSHWNWTDRLSNKTSITLPYNPFTNYTVMLKVKPLLSGYWSNETTLQFQTPSSVPCQQPNLNPSGFTLTSLDSLNRILMLYWKPVPEDKYCGPDFHYVLSVRSSGNWSDLNETILDTHKEILIGPNKTQIRILAKNREGLSLEHQDIIQIPSFPTVSPVEEVVVEVNTSNLSYAMVHWKYSLDGKNVIRAVIFWCNSVTNLPDVVTCKNNIEWKELDKTQRDFRIFTNPDVRLMRVGIAVELLGISCGIKWSTAVYALDKVAPPPELSDAVPSHADHGLVHVVWKKPKCSNSLCGHVDKYILYYCIVVVDGDRCAENSHNVSIASTQFAYNLTSLSYGSKYRLWMLSNSSAGLSKSSVVLTVEISKHWKTAGNIVGIAIGALVAALIVICGLYGIYKCCRKYEKKIARGVEIVLPRGAPVSKIMKTSSSSETQILYNCYPSGYSRQGSDMSTLSRDSGRYSLTNPCTTSNVMVLQQMSPLMSRPNGTLIASTNTPLIGIQEDGAADDVFPEVQGLDGSNYVKTIVVEDPDDNSGYKVIRTVDSCRVNDKLANGGQHMSKVESTKQPEVWVCSSPPSHTSLPDDGLFSQMPVLLHTTADADNCAYIRIAPGTNLGDFDALYKSPQIVPAPAACVPLAGTDVSYATVEMLDPSLSILASVGPGGGCAGNAVENGYTDLAFLTNSLLGNSCQFGGIEQPSSHSDVNVNHQIDLEAVSSEEAVSSDLSRRSSQPFSSERIFANSELNGNNNSDFKSLIDPMENCLEVVASSDQNCEQFKNSFDSHPVSSSTQSNLSRPAKELEKENCNDIIPSGRLAQCDNGYILHNDLMGNMINM